MEYNCRKCEYITYDTKRWKYHLTSNKHIISQMYGCDECHKTFTCERDLLKHKVYEITTLLKQTENELKQTNDKLNKSNEISAIYKEKLDMNHKNITELTETIKHLTKTQAK